METYERTAHCGELRISDVGKEVALLGWVAKRRNLGSLVFIDLRDRRGIVQVTVHTDEIDLPDIRNEYVISVKGKVAKKLETNPNLPTGEVEVIAQSIKVINTAEQPPIATSDVTDASDDIRLKYRYLDLRRPSMQKRFFVRAKIVKAVHEYLDSHDFIEIETPQLTPSTPEGARDYLVPSRLHHGSFYALPQSPQLFKQLLMVSGFERYYQVARCFRDEDLRADRQPDFTQIDIETSFLNEDQILSLSEGLLKKIFKDTIGYDIKLPLRRMEYDVAVDSYGSDKPDTRFGMLIHDLSKALKDSAFEGYNEAKYVRGFKVDGVAKNVSRKKLDELNLLAKKFNLKYFGLYKYENSKLEGSFVKYLSEKSQSDLIAELELKEGDAAFVAEGNSRHDVAFGLGALRSQFAHELGLIEPDTYDLLWVVHFPLFEKSEEDGSIVAVHHPFTRPCDEDLAKLKSDPLSVYAYAYDIVINGFEAGGGSLRIYDQKVQREIFEVLGLSKEDIDRKFGRFVNALKYGTPPHGGLAFGLDRLAMILSGTDNIRDVIAFPKNLSGVDPVTNAPYEVSDEQLKILGIEVTKEEK
jgi:aspartyl-tRNA synthetase